MIVNTKETDRLMKSILKADFWICLTADLENKELRIHSDMELDEALNLITAYILHDEDYRLKLLLILQKENIL